MPSIILTNQSGSFDVSNLAASVKWSGDYRQCARNLAFSIVSSAEDQSVARIDCPVGSAVVCREGNEVLFDGFVFSRSKSTQENTIDLNCYDRGFYLNRNQTSKKFQGVTPEDASRMLCGEFGIPVGQLEATGIPLSRKFIGKNLYEIIMSLYTLASERDGKVYYLAFEGEKLTVREKGAFGKAVVITGGANLLAASTSESAERIVNQVAVFDGDLNQISVTADEESVSLYGSMQSAIRQEAGGDSAEAAKNLLGKSGVEQIINVSLLGNTACRTGGSVMVKEPYTGLYGLFYIDSDLHRWENGIYQTQLVLNLKSVTDEKQAGEKALK